MGGNGSFSSSSLETESGRNYHTIYSLSKNIKVIKMKDGVKHGTMPTESHTANRVYVTMRKDGSGVREISRYGKDHKKQWTIHTHEHRPYKVHYHKWKNGKQQEEAFPLTPKLKKLYEKIIKMQK